MSADHTSEQSPPMKQALVQTIKGLAWRNRLALRLATATVDGAYLLRRSRRRQPGPFVPPVDSDGASDLQRYRRYLAEFGSVEGWFTDGAIATWDVLLAYQAARGWAGDLLEIGVLRGKSASLMALHARPEEAVLLVDPALRREAVDLVSEAHPGKNLLLRHRSDEIGEQAEIASRRGKLRWIHIDGEHSGPAVSNDLALAADLLSPEGVICLDDFFAPAYPQITRAALAYLGTSPHLHLFLLGYRKAFICRSEMSATYLSFVRDHLVPEYRRRGFADFTLCKTNEASDMNCFGVIERRGEMDYKGPDHAPGQLPI
jgi:Methyltransferase domain